MAALIGNQALGRLNEWAKRVNGNDPANSAFIVVLLKTAESNATLQDYDSLGAALAAGGGTANEEADFTNYARKVLTDASISDPSVDDTNNRQEFDVADIVWTSAGGVADNTLVKLLVCYDEDTTSGSDTDIFIAGIYDFSTTTDGNNLTAQINASGLWRAASA